MNPYQITSDPLNGTSTAEVKKKALKELQKIMATLPGETAYVKAPYFGGEAIYVGSFWALLNNRYHGEQFRRARLFTCALELLTTTDQEPVKVTDLHGDLYRFMGETKSGEQFYVHVRYDKTIANRKEFISVYPAKPKK